jgi:hypothetical protein
MLSEPLNAAKLKIVRTLLTIFIVGLVLSGITAIPLVEEVNMLVRMTDAHAVDSGLAPREWAVLLTDIQATLVETNDRFPFLFYGTDWLAIGHIVIPVAFIGTWKDPVNNEWLFDFGLIACAMVIPRALVFGAIRGIPIWWRLIDCSFGVIGAIPLWWCRSIIKHYKLATVI